MENGIANRLQGRIKDGMKDGMEWEMEWRMIPSCIPLLHSISHSIPSFISSCSPLSIPFAFSILHSFIISSYMGKHVFWIPQFMSGYISQARKVEKVGIQFDFPIRNSRFSVKIVFFLKRKHLLEEISFAYTFFLYVLDSLSTRARACNSKKRNTQANIRVYECKYKSKYIFMYIYLDLFVLICIVYIHLLESIIIFLTIFSIFYRENKHLPRQNAIIFLC